MVEKQQDVLVRAYARLSALRKNIADMADYKVLETYVSEFHAVLDSIESAGIDIAEFRVPSPLIQPRISSSSRSSNGSVHNTYYDGKYVDKAFILTKLDSILAYFEFSTSDKPRKIGFIK